MTNVVRPLNSSARAAWIELLALGVEIAGGLVEDRGSAGRPGCAGNGEALSLAAGQFEPRSPISVSYFRGFAR